ncbi:MAG: hypothetical protein ACLFU2_08595 [Opitutales bacterium]
MTSDPNSPSPAPGQPRQLNLQELAGQFMAGVQRHFDNLCFNLAARESATESAYDTRAKAAALMPAGQFHQNFEQMQAYSRDLLLRQVIGDALNLAVAALHNAHFFLALVRINATNPVVSPEAQKEAQALQQAFVRAPLDQKFNQLEQHYGVLCELEDTVTSLGFLVQVLLRQGGVVRAEQLDDNGELSLELQTAGEGGPSGAGGLSDLEVRTRVFREGDKVTFEDVELQLTFVTVAVFAHQLFASVARFARETGGPSGHH